MRKFESYWGNHYIGDNMNDKLIIVGVNEAKISTEENSIIGTVGLATCVGVLLYSREHKKAIVAHVASDPLSILDKTLELIDEYNLSSSPLEYKVIRGYYKSGYKTDDVLESMYSAYPKYFIPYQGREYESVGINLESHQFAFDASSGTFVTNQVFSNNESFVEEQTKKIF